MKLMRLTYLVPITLLFFTAYNHQTGSKNQGTAAVAEDLGAGFKPVAATDNGVSEETETQETQRKAEAWLAELGKRIKELKTRVERAGDKAKSELNKLTKELDEKMAVAKQQLEKFKSASDQAWKDAKSKVAAAMDDLEKSYDRASERIKKSEK